MNNECSDGTSMAAPHVAGVLSLMLSVLLVGEKRHVCSSEPPPFSCASSGEAGLPVVGVVMIVMIVLIRRRRQRI